MAGNRVGKINEALYLTSGNFRVLYVIYFIFLKEGLPPSNFFKIPKHFDENSRLLLPVGVQNGTATIVKRLAVSDKTKHPLTTQ